MSTVPMTDIEAGQASSSYPAATQPPELNQTYRSTFFNRLLGSWLLMQPSTTSTSEAPDDANASSSFFYRNQPERYAEGWPRLAAEQEAYANTAIHRRFGYLLQRVIVDCTTKLTDLEGTLYELEQRWLEGGMQAPERQGLPDTTEDSQLSYEIAGTLQKISSLLPSYYRFLECQKFLGSLDEVHRPEFRNIYQKIQSDGYLNEQEMAYLHYPEDFISTSSDPLWRIAEGWLFKLPMCLLVFLFEDPSTKKEENVTFLSSQRIRIVAKSILICIYALLLLSPVSLLYFFPAMGKKTVICVVFGSTVAFASVMAAHPGIKMESVLVASCAYAAILATLLENLQ
nr:uncharacterized protein CTRU02_06950 [Colletotrichum truncatum]KAF6791766.1 hypothetical protein CTRU02_06950 [Colletotrichum truncatum]